MTLTAVDVRTAAAMVAGGATLFDIREQAEFDDRHIPGARHAPLSALGPIEAPGAVIFHCLSGMRTLQNSAQLAASTPGAVYLMTGGLNAWMAAGQPVSGSGAGRVPLDLMRQVQLIGGSLIVLTVALGWLVSPGFLLMAGAIGCGMIHAGVTGSCAMTKLLAPLPWNRAPAAMAPAE